MIETLASGLTFTECPRWHNGALWFSDFYTETVYRLDVDGTLNAVVSVPGEPAGLGWNPEGELLVVSQRPRQLLRFDGEQLHLEADLSTLATANCNDMLVTEQGFAYIGNWGFDIGDPSAVRQAADLALVRNGEAVVAAEQMMFPNGMALLDEGRTLVVAETSAARLTAFTIAEDGSLSDRRVWAELSVSPDGITADAEGGIWVATVGPELIRVVAGGAVTHRIPFDQYVIAVELGGENRDQLYVCTTRHLWPEECRMHRTARIDRVDLKQI